MDAAEVRRRLKSVTRDKVLRAIADFDVYYPKNDYEHWLDKRIYKYAVVYEGKLYPPKYVMELATGVGVSEGLAGGWGKPYGVNVHFKHEGFRVILKPTL